MNYFISLPLDLQKVLICYFDIDTLLSWETVLQLKEAHWKHYNDTKLHRNYRDLIVLHNINTKKIFDMEFGHGYFMEAERNNYYYNEHSASDILHKSLKWYIERGLNPVEEQYKFVIAATNTSQRTILNLLNGHFAIPHKLKHLAIQAAINRGDKEMCEYWMSKGVKITDLDFHWQQIYKNRI